MDERGELEWLLEHAKSERDARLVLGLGNGDPLWLIGERSGYSPGRFKSEQQRRKNLSASVSRASNAERIQLLLTAFLERRVHGTSDIAPSEEVLKRITSIARTATGATGLAAAKFLVEFHARHEAERHPDPEKFPREVIEFFGLEKGTLMWTIAELPKYMIDKAAVENGLSPLGDHEFNAVLDAVRRDALNGGTHKSNAAAGRGGKSEVLP